GDDGATGRGVRAVRRALDRGAALARRPRRLRGALPPLAHPDRRRRARVRGAGLPGGGRAPRPPDPPARRLVVRGPHAAPGDLPAGRRARPVGRASPRRRGVGPPRHRRPEPAAARRERAALDHLAPRRAADRAGSDPPHRRARLRRRVGPGGPPLTARATAMGLTPGASTALAAGAKT